MLKIDVFNHIMPRRYFEKFQEVAARHGDMVQRSFRIPLIVDLDARFARRVVTANFDLRAIPEPERQRDAA